MLKNPVAVFSIASTDVVPAPMVATPTVTSTATFPRAGVLLAVRVVLLAVVALLAKLAADLELVARTLVVDVVHLHPEVEKEDQRSKDAQEKQQKSLMLKWTTTGVARRPTRVPRTRAVVLRLLPALRETTPTREPHRQHRMMTLT